MPAIVRMSPNIIISTVCLILLASSAKIQASGVFELELLSLDQLDAGRPPDERSNDPLRILICLKEAFASQLDGPCPFGNASITLNKGSLHVYNEEDVEKSSSSGGDIATIDNESIDATSNRTRQEAQSKQSQQAYRQPKKSAQKQLGSPLTNLVRILFTFRWTKAFTIILSAEELQIDSGVQRIHHPQNLRQQAAPAATGLTRGPQANASHSIISGDSFTIATSNKSTTNSAANLPQFIDRHVLTENEVLPNLELNPNKLWSNRFSRSLKSSLAYRFRVYCSLNYYGDGCTTFCRPRDDQFGHYNCSSTGQKVCLEGWAGTDCDQAKCRPGCNSQHGFCDKPDTCQCRPGWTGLRCDECITYPGCQNGYCLSSWQCICQRNWGGVLCDQDLNYCGTHEPCKNNGTCQNVAPGKYKCHCPAGFAGADCEINLSALTSIGSLTQLSAGCALNPCLNGGTCYGFNGQLVDSAGDIVSQVEAIEAPANNAMLSDRLYRCQCLPGWTGDYCQWSDIATLPMTDLLTGNNGTEPSNPTNSPTSLSEPAATQTVIDDQIVELSGKSLPTMITVDQVHPPHPSLDMKHLISGVVVASVIGVFLASLLLAWTCLVMIERNKFSFIQMNIIRSSSSNDGDDGLHTVSSTLRRMHDKIRDSFRRSSRSRIIPNSKLNIENVLGPPKPPPSYEESSQNHVNRVAIEYTTVSLSRPESKQLSLTAKVEHAKEPADEVGNLVTRGALAQKLASIQSSKGEKLANKSDDYVSTAQLSCPRHGHLYRQRATNHQRLDDESSPALYLPIKYYHQHTSDTIVGITHNEKTLEPPT